MGKHSEASFSDAACIASQGWLDRCFLPTVAFTLPSSEPGSPPASIVGLCPVLTNVTKVGVVTTYGSKFGVMRWVGDCGRRTLARGVRPLLGPQCTLVWEGLYDADGSTKEQREAFLERIRAAYSEF